MSLIKFNKLVDYISKLDSVLVAVSGGVDSALLLAASTKALGKERVMAVTASSPVDPPGDLDTAQELAAFLGVEWKMLESQELMDADFIANTRERCYHCKKGLLKELLLLARRQGLARVLEGSNYDDLKDYRPGYKAVREAGVLSPLTEVEMTKGEIREASRKLGLSCWNRPSGACLATRIPYGEVITESRLKRIALAESILHDLGQSVVRVRDHGEIARLEVAEESIAQLSKDGVRQNILRRFKELGYKYVTIDLQGYKTGSMN